MHQKKSGKKPALLEENLKKALTEMLMLYLLSKKECFIGELTALLYTNSRGALKITFPYAAIYRLQKSEYITVCHKRNAPDGRLRQYYTITSRGRKYLTQLLEIYHKFSSGVSVLLEGKEFMEAEPEALAAALEELDLSEPDIEAAAAELDETVLQEESSAPSTEVPE